MVHRLLNSADIATRTILAEAPRGRRAAAAHFLHQEERLLGLGSSLRRRSEPLCRPTLTLLAWVGELPTTGQADASTSAGE